MYVTFQEIVAAHAISWRAINKFRTILLLMLLLSKKLTLATLLLCSLPIAAQEDVTEDANKQNSVSREQLNQQWYEQLFSEKLAEEAIWLGEGENRFLGLYKTANNGPAKGTLIFIKEAGSRLGAVDEIALIRESFTDHGWNTLTISLPDYPNLKPPTRIQPEATTETEADQTQPNEAETADPEQAWQTSISDCLTTTQQYVRQNSNIENHSFIIAGNSAWAALRWPELFANPDDGSKLVLLNAATPKTGTNDDMLTDNMQGSSLPVLDIRIGNDSKHIQQEAKNLQLSAYQYLRLPSASVANQHGETLLAKRIRGWLDRS